MSIKLDEHAKARHQSHSASPAASISKRRTVSSRFIGSPPAAVSIHPPEALRIDDPCTMESDMPTVTVDCGELLSQGVWAIMESRRVRTRARTLTREARKALQRPRALLEAMIAAPDPQHDLDRRRLRAIVRALRRREPARSQLRGSDKRGTQSQPPEPAPGRPGEGPFAD